MIFWPKGLPDLMDEPRSAYHEKANSERYEAEKGLLDLYRTFVTELLRISLAGVAVLGFLSKLANGGDLNCLSKFLGASSMVFFAVSSFLALAFLYASSNGYRCYIAGLRAKVTNLKTEHSSNYYLEIREKMLKSCRWTKFLATAFLALGAFTAMLAIWSVFLSKKSKLLISFCGS